MRRWLQFIFLLLAVASANAQLTVTVSLVKVAGQKAIVPLKMRNAFPEKIESARATAFLLDGQDKVVGQATQWVIGGTKDRPALGPDKETTFHLVVERRGTKGKGQTAPPPVKAKVAFTRLVLEGGKSVDPSKHVQIQQGSQ